MKRIILIFVIGLISFGIGYWTSLIKSSVDEKFAFVDNVLIDSGKLNGENFDDFIYKFISDSLFQLERIKFPLKSQQLGLDLDKVDSTRIEKKDWKIIRLFWGEQYRPQIYDNFNKEMRNTNERLFCWEGVENGINVEYKFQRIGGLWYLIEYNDFST